jgi:autotransporter-associated beta strand protein
MKLHNRTSATLAALLALQAICLGSTPVSITNPGFEDPVPPDDGNYLPSATGWSKVNSATEIGVWNPAIADFTLEAPEGTNVGYVYGGVENAGLAQVLTATLIADASYSLSVKVGNSLTYAYDGYRAQLLAGGTVLAEDNNSLSPGSNSFVTATVNYTYNAGLHAALVGQPLEIRLLGMGQSAGTEGQTEFDDVQLTVALANPIAVPGGPYAVFVGGSLLLNGGASLPSDGATLTTYEWDLDNDGDFDEAITGATPAAITEATLISTYGMSLGSNTIKLRVTDSAAKTSVSETTVNILPDTAVVYEPFAYAGTALAGQSGSSEVGLTGTWTSNTNPTLFSNLGFGSLVTRGAGIGNLPGGSNTFGGARTVSASALAGNGLLQNGATLWFSVIMGYDTGGNVTNSRLALCLANSSFSTANFSYFFTTAGHTGLGVVLGGSNVGNGRVAATQFRDNTFGTGLTGNVHGTLSPVLYGAGQRGLIVGKITWGASSDTLEIYVPGPDLVLPQTPVSTLTVNVDQSNYNTLTWARGDRVVMDEIRFGASYSAVVETGSAWDLNGTTAGSGGPTPSGIWNAADSNWNVAPDGTLAPVPWTPGGVAVFSAGTDATGDYTVSVDGTRDISGIVFEDGTTTVTGGTALRLTGNATLTVGGDRSATVNTPLSEDAAGREISKGGSGLLVLTADNSALTGTTSLNAGVTCFDSPSTIPGTAKNLFLNAGGTAMFGPTFGAANIPTALADRVVAASTGTIAADNYASTDFDFNTPGLTAASLGAVGTVSYTGTLTPNGTTYRLGGGGGTLTIPTANAITGENALIANGTGTVVLAEGNDYTGATTVAGGSTLRILGPTSTSSVAVNQIASVLEVGHNDALGTGTLTFGGGFGAAPSIRPIGTIVTTNPVSMAGNFNIEGTGSLTLGTVTTTGGNPPFINNVNTTNPTTIAAITASGAARAISFSGNGNTTVTGIIGGGSGVTNLAKNGDGTLTLQGVNTYTGTTTVNNAGTLLVVSPGSLPAGAVTLNNTSTLAGNGTIGGNVTVTATANVAPGGSSVGTLPITGNLTITAMAGSTGTLRYQLGPIANSDKITVGGTLTTGVGALGFDDFVFTDVGGMENGTYTLITATSLTVGNTLGGTLSGAIGTGGTGTLQLNGSNLELVVTGLPAASGYSTWVSGPFAGTLTDSTASLDFDGGGLATGIEWVVGGDPTLASDDAGKAPTFNNSDPNNFVFTYRRRDAAQADPNTAIAVQYSLNLNGWATATHGVDGVTIDDSAIPEAGFRTVAVSIPKALATPGGKLFARLNVVITP